MAIHLKTIKIKKLFYPFLLALVLLVLFILSFLSIKYLSNVTNRVLASGDAVSGDLINLDLDDYNAVAAKIGLPLAIAIAEENDVDSEIISESGAVQESPATSSADFTATTTTSTTEVSASVNKQEIKMAIYNGTSKAGLASELRDKLSAVGFVDITIGSIVTSTAGTIIGVKESASSVYSEIAGEVGKTYANTIRQSLAEDSVYDVWITIGL